MEISTNVQLDYIRQDRLYVWSIRKDVIAIFILSFPPSLRFSEK
jgi:hypothetical protein